MILNLNYCSKAHSWWDMPSHKLFWKFRYVLDDFSLFFIFVPFSPDMHPKIRLRSKLQTLRASILLLSTRRSYALTDNLGMILMVVLYLLVFLVGGIQFYTRAKVQVLDFRPRGSHVGPPAKCFYFAQEEK